MKKLLAILLALLMVVSLFACGGGGSKEETKPDAPADNPSDTTPSGDDKEPAETPDETPADDGGAKANTIGFYEDALASEHDTYNFVFIHLAVTQLCSDEANAMAEFQDRLNFKLTEVNASGDSDKLITMVEEYCIDEVDGLIIDAGYNITRIDEICADYGIPYVTLNNPLYTNETDRVCMAPCVVIDSYSSGGELVKWMVEHYKDYWGEVDTSKIGYIGGTFSASVDIQYRVEGGKAAFLEAFPENESKAFFADCVTNTLNVDTAYGLISDLITANKDIEYWIIVAAAGDIGTGAARAVENLGLEKTCLIGSVPGSTLMAEWQTGYEGCWVCCVDFRYLDMACQALSGLIALADGRATMDNLWEEYRAPTDLRTKYPNPCSVLTAQTFKTFYEELYEEYGFEYKGAK